MKRSFLFFLTTMLAVMISGAAFAQINLASIEGSIVDESKNPIIGATVMVKNESTGFTTGVVTDLDGKFALRQLPLGSPYTVTASYLGYASVSNQGYSLNQGDNIVVNFNLQPSTTEMEVVVVVAESFQDKIGVLGATTSVNREALENLPVNGRDFTSLTDLSPLSSGSSLSGQIATATNYSLDGMSASGTTSGGTAGWGPYVVSMEAISEFEIITNSYDVTLGRGGGGTISAVTKSGTNTLHGSAFIYNRADELSSQYDSSGKKVDNEYSQTQFGFSLGGPIIKDKAHFFIAAESQIETKPFSIADIRDESDESTYGITAENLSKFLEISYDQYGVSSDYDQVGTFDRTTPSQTATARIDWQLNDKNFLTVRNNMNRYKLTSGVGDNSSINLYEVYANHLSFDNSLLATLRTSISDNKTNELKVQHRYILDDGTVGSQLPESNIPRAIVTVKSDQDGDGVDDLSTTIQIGGQRYSPEQFKDNSFQIVDNFYYNTNFANWTFGADLLYTRLSSLATSEMNGRFYYASLEDYENNTPYRYAREIAVDDPTAKQSVINGAVYAQADKRLAKGLNVVAGVRAEYTHYFQNPEENEALQTNLALSTTNKVKAFQIQPRVQFTWDVNDNHKDIIKIGGGVVGSNMNNYAMINNLQFSGNNIYSIDLTGDDIPTADFVGYRNGTATAPGYELFGQYGIEPASTYNINSADIKMPVTYKYNFSYNRFFTPTLRAGVSFFGSNTRNNYMYVDRNMVDDPFFTLDNEGGRGVYVPASTIDSNGNTDWTNGRKTTALNRVLELVSEGVINSYSLVFDANWRYARDGSISASYTWNDTKDNTSYNGNVANSATLYRDIADDPRDMSTISYSDNQFRHKFVLYGNTPSFHGFRAGIRYSGIGGQRYSMKVNGNVNGDYVSTNDLAFVFDTSLSSTADNIKEGIEKILNNPDADERFKDYLRESTGSVAARNGGINKFYGTFDIKLSKDFNFRNNQKLAVTVDFFNFANLLCKNWGLTKTLGDQYLYYIDGFDQETQQYEYIVNTNAGVASDSGDPWQIQLGMKYSF
ncbi:MAG: carboxypeptidase regulatory-like domain-containing protein [Rikenellaceae bacterium]